jgi:hypothetical protein
MVKTNKQTNKEVDMRVTSESKKLYLVNLLREAQDLALEVFEIDDNELNTEVDVYSSIDNVLNDIDSIS